MPTRVQLQQPYGPFYPWVHSILLANNMRLSRISVAKERRHVWAMAATTAFLVLYTVQQR